MIRFFICLFVCPCLLGAFASASAASRHDFIQSPLRSDFVHSPTDGILYIANESEIRRYDVRGKHMLSGFPLGEARLAGIDLSPDGRTLAVADRTINGRIGHVWLIDARTGWTRRLQFALETYEAGSFSVAFGKDGKLLVSTEYRGSGGTPLRLVDPATGQVKVIVDSVNAPAILDASRDRAVIVWTESGISDGPVGLYRVDSGEVIRRDGYDLGVGAFTYASAADRTASRFAFPTYKGMYVFDHLLGKTLPPVGTYAGPQPVGVAFHPKRDLLYCAWAETNEIRVFDSRSLRQVGTIRLSHPTKPLIFAHPANQPFKPGRLRIDPSGRYLFASVADGVAVVRP